LQETDSVGLAIRAVVESIHDLLEWHLTQISNVTLAIAEHHGEPAPLHAETRRLIKRATAANLAIQEAAWAAVVSWHELNSATINTGKLAGKYDIATHPGAEDEKPRRKRTSANSWRHECTRARN
jgi:hypothetical protein